MQAKIIKDEITLDNLNFLLKTKGYLNDAGFVRFTNYIKKTQSFDQESV